MARARLPEGQVAKKLLSIWGQRLRTGILSAQTPSYEWSRRPAQIMPSCLFRGQASVSLHWERVTLVLPLAAVPARAGSPAWPPFPDQKANGSCSSPRAPCCTFHRHAPGERSEKRVPFLKALSTGASVLLSQAEGMPRHRGFRSMRVYYTVLRRPAQARGESLRPDSDFPKNAVLSQRGYQAKEAFALCGILP